MGHTPDLTPNLTLLIQLGIFFACYFVMRGLVFGPYLRLLNVRRERTIGSDEDAREAVAKAEARKTQYEAYMLEERKKAQLFADEKKREIAEEEKSIIQAGREAASKELEVLRSNSKAELDKASKELAPLVNEYASAISSKLLGRKVQISSASVGGASSSSREEMVRE